MKRKMTFMLLSAFLIFLLGACGTSDDQSGETGGDHAGHEETDAEQGVHPLTVDMQLPEKAIAGEEVTIRTIVTMGDEIVEDADEVKYEIRNEAGDSEMIVAEFDGKDSYPIKKTFDEPGTYKVIPHTTARGQHTMPAKDITVE